MKKTLAMALAATLATTMLTAAAPQAMAAADPTQGDPVSINIGHFGSETTAVQAGALAMKDYLEKETNGRITVNVYPNNSMGSDDELCQMVQEGNIEMTLANSIIVNYVPDAAIYDTFYNFDSIDDVKAKYQNDDNFLSVMRETYANNGFYLGGYSVHGFRLTTANKEIHTSEDLKGLTFRVMQNDFHIKAWQALGATPTPFSFSELYTALQQGTVDAQENPVETIYSAKLYEQQKYITRTNHLQQVQQWLMNLDFYNNLTDDDKVLVDAAIQEGCKVATDSALEKEAEWTKEIEDFGCTFVDLTDEERAAFKEAVAPEWDDVKAAVSEEVWNAYINK